MRLFPLALFAAAVLSAQQPVVVQNEWVKVIRAANIPSQLSRPHVHLVNRVMIHLDKGVLRIDNKETGVARDIPFRAGEVRWDPRVGLHTSENVGGSAIRIIEIELNDNPPRPRPAKLKKPHRRFQPDMENDQVRITRATLQPGEQPKETVFPTPVVAVRLSDGQSTWQPARGEAIKNDSPAPAEYVFVELK